MDPMDALFDRCSALLASLSPEEVARYLVEECGEAPEDVWLALKAAQVHPAVPKGYDK